MSYETLETLAKTNRWTDLEKEWLATIEKPEAVPARLMPVIDMVVKAGQGKLADSLGWAWLSSAKEGRGATEALQIGRDLLVRLSDGDELREEILSLYRNTHSNDADLEKWIERSGLKSGKSVRRALRYLDVGLRLKPGALMLHRSEDLAAQIESIDFDSDEVVIKTSRRTQTVEIAQVIDEYDVVEADDFRVLAQLDPARLKKLLVEDPATAMVGLLRAHGNKINRDNLKTMIAPRYIPTEKWTDWWTSLRNAVKKSPNLRIEGRSPMFLIFDPVGKTPEQEAWDALTKATTPREWLELLETYLRDTRAHKRELDNNFLQKAQAFLVDRIERFARHKEGPTAFATALVVERVVADGLPVATNAHGTAVKMLANSSDPVAAVAGVPDARLWSLGIDCVEQAFPERWPEIYAELVLFAPAGQCDPLAKKVEKAGRGDLLQSIVDRALADPGRYTDALLWVWKGPELTTTLSLPPLTELLSIVLSLVGPARVSEGKTAGQTINEMRGKVRSGLSHKSYGKFSECLKSLDESMAQTVRRQLERAEGLGPSAQDDMLNILRAKFPLLYVKAKVTMWDDESVLYFTAPGLKRKEMELDELVNVKMRENAKAIGEAASHGDLSENSEYKFALEERDLLRARVAKLNRELSLAKLLEPNDIPTDHVSVGQHITLLPTAGGDPLNITLLGYDEANIANSIYSYKSPLAMNLMGRKIGEKVVVKIGDREGEFTVAKVSTAL